MHRTSIILCFFLILSAISFADHPDSNICQVITPEMCPALLYVDADTIKIAGIQNGETQTLKLTFPANISLFGRLDRFLFYVKSGNDISLVNFKTGEINKVSEDIAWYADRLLRTVPEKGKAMFLWCDMRTYEVHLTELNLKTLEMKPYRRLGKDIFGEEWARICTAFTISPDFKKLAYTVKHGPRSEVARPSKHDLRILDLNTLERTTVDDNVNVTISPFSSSPYGVPPHEWLDERTLVYQDIIPGATQNDLLSSATHTIKTCDLPSMKIKERFSQDLHLELSGGSMQFDPFLRKIKFRNVYLLTDDWTLAPIMAPYRTEYNRDTKETTIFRHDIELWREKDQFMTRAIPSSGNNFVYGVHNGSGFNKDLYAFYGDATEPVKIGTLSNHGYLVGWIEAEDFKDTE